VAEIVTLDPSLVSNLQEITIMGGAVNVAACGAVIQDCQ